MPDLDKAAGWYTSVMGFHELRARTETNRSVTPGGGIFKIYPESLQKVRMAYLSAGNGVGIELFQFMEPSTKPGEEANFEKNYARGGYFHMAITVPDCDSAIEKIVANGGKLIGKSVTVFDHYAAYVSDPWGNVIEVITGSFERIMSNR